MSQAVVKATPTTVVPLVRDEYGRIREVATPPSQVDWQLLYEWRNLRRSAHGHQAEIEAADQWEAKWRGLRSLTLFVLMSAVLVGFMIAGAIG